MEIKNIVEVSMNGIFEFARGTEEELVEAWNEGKDDFIGWLTENEREKYDEIMEIEIEEFGQLKALFEEELDYDWYKMLILTDKELEQIKIERSQE